MSEALKILAVDDNQDAAYALEALLKREGYDVYLAHSGEQTLKCLELFVPDIILLDIQMPGPDGYEVTKRIKADESLRYIPIVLLTAKDELEDVVFGLEQGADDYIKKPFRSEELLARIKAALRTRQLYEELKSASATNTALKLQLKQRSNYGNIIGSSPTINEVFNLIERVKDSDVPVLISGESGVGKELVASAIHYNSSRRAEPFVVQNCSAFHENLLESELFGHVKGSFTGAIRDKQGLFEAANNGTFFLDELGEMSPALQVKLLRVLQDGTFMPVGGTATKKVNVRILAATNRNLRDMIQDGKFREDLYYRLNVVNINIPSLRQRRSDIPQLLDHFLEAIAKKSASKKKSFSSSALKALCDYSWPGNIRELQNETERCVLLSGEEQVIQAEILSPHISKPNYRQLAAGDGVGHSLKEAIETLERKMISEALEKAKGNKSEVARLLGISRSNLIAKIQTFGLDP